MQTVSTVKSLRDTINGLRENGGKIGFVPTMGALHAGHISLVEETRKHCDTIVVSIFVNPIQFDQADDLQKYPKQLEADSGLLKEAGVALLYTPTAEEMYPNGFATSVNVSGVSDGLCGAARLGHFDGVATVPLWKCANAV